MSEILIEKQIERQQKKQAIHALEEAKVLLIQGPKGINKTAFALEVIHHFQGEVNLLERRDYRDLEKDATLDLETWLKNQTQDTPFLILKNAEYIGKLQELMEVVLMSELDVKVILICSFAPILDELLIEALEGSGLIINLSPFSFYELAQVKGMGTLEKELEERLVFGSYPSIITNPENAETVLMDLVDHTLVSQLGANDRINKKKELIAVLKILAFEMGEIISFNDIGMRSNLDNETVERYVELFEKAFLLYRIPAYYGGNKYEMKKGVSIYFADNGIRNALINNFNSMEWRNDATQLWRNWLFVEKMKWNRNLGKRVDYYTWKTHTKQSVDCLEIENGKMRAYQTSWTKKKNVRFPAGFTKNYPDAETFQLNRSTYWSFLTSKK